MNDAREILADYPDLRAAVQDVAAITGDRVPPGDVDLNLRGPDMDKLQAYSERDRRLDARAAVTTSTSTPACRCASRSCGSSPTASGCRDLGVSIAERVDDGQRARRRRAGEQVQGARRAVRRLAAGRALGPRRPRSDRAAWRVPSTQSPGWRGAAGQRRPASSTAPGARTRSTASAGSGRW